MKGALKRGVDLTARCAILSGFVGLLEKLGDRKTQLLRVLTYHRVDEPDANPNLYPNLIGATPEGFDWQMSYLAANYRVVSMADVLDALVHGVPLPPKSVLITFDDGYKDFAEHAWPILRRYELPVTLFVPTGFPDQPQQAFWWDRLYAAVHRTTCDELVTPAGRISLADSTRRASGMRQLVSLVKSLPDDEAKRLVEQVCTDLGSPAARNPVLGWQSLRRLAAEGVTLAPHTRHHPLLNRVGAERARDEIAGAILDLQTELGDVLPVIAYPSGAYDRRVVEMLPPLGVKLAFTTCRGLNDLRSIDPLRIRRINVGRGTSQALLRTQLLAWTVHLNRWLPLPNGDVRPLRPLGSGLDL
ncbi:MAG: polysaccharide deacetylase family protein [Pirellulaceae bacterium]